MRHEFYVYVHLQKLWSILIVDLDQSLTTWKLEKQSLKNVFLKVFCWTHWNFKIFTGASVLLTSKLANSPQNFCQQEPFVKTNVSCMSITPSLYRISTAPSQYAKVINKNFAHRYIFIQRSECYACWLVVAHDLLEYR